MRRLATLACLPLVLAVPLLQQAVDRRLATFVPRAPELYLWSGEQLKVLAPGFDDLLADVYWIRTVQYFGGQRLGESPNFDLLYPLLDIATTLDPRLVIAYKYGAVFLCEPWPVGKGDCRAGISILEKGVRAMPANWRLRQDLGYFRYVFMDDPVGAARELFAAVRLEGAPGWLADLAEVFLAKGTDRQTSKEVWRRLYDGAEGEFLKERALENLRRLDALDAIDALNLEVDAFARRHGRPPRTVEELTAEGLDPRSLLDPTGIAYAYDPDEGRFWFSQASRMWSLLGKRPRPEGAAGAAGAAPGDRTER